MMEELLQKIKPLACLVSANQRLSVIYRGWSHPSRKVNLTLQKLCFKGGTESEMGGAKMWLLVMATT